MNCLCKDTQKWNKDGENTDEIGGQGIYHEKLEYST